MENFHKISLSWNGTSLSGAFKCETSEDIDLIVAMLVQAQPSLPRKADQQKPSALSQEGE